MATCPYCASGLEKDGAKHYCGFCSMHTTPAENGERTSGYQNKPFVTELDLQKTTPELMTYSTVDLIELLGVAREETRDAFGIMFAIRRGGKDLGGFEKSSKDAGDRYEEMKRNVWRIENILKDRVGYYPKAVSQKVLENWRQRVEESNEPMQMRKEPKKSIEMSIPNHVHQQGGMALEI